MCTTGAPSRSSVRFLITASLLASLRFSRRRRCMTRCPNSGLSATRARAGSCSSRPSSRGAMVIARRSLLVTKSVQLSTVCGRSFRRSSSSSSTSRRPADSAVNSTRPGNWSRKFDSAAKGWLALASMARLGSAWAAKRSPVSRSSWLATMRGQLLSRAKQSSTGRNSSAGGSNGRAGSMRRSS
ncbi:hypothetical protein D3C76_1299300 [compost metagenome]